MANPHCQSMFRERKKFCPKCGRPLVSDVSKERNICGMCERGSTIEDTETQG